MKTRNNFYWIIAITVILFILIFLTGNYGRVLIFILLGSVFVATLFSIISQTVKEKREEEQYNKISMLKLTSKFALLFLTSGTFIYVLTFLTIEQESLGIALFSNVELFFRSLICSFDLFLLDIDSNIIDRVDNHAALKAWIFIQGILSALCTATFFLNLIISRFKFMWKLHVVTRISDVRSRIYLFFGLNEATEILAKDIHGKDSRALIILVDEANVNDEEKDGIQRALSFFGHRMGAFTFADRIDGIITVSNTSLNSLNAADENSDILGYLGLNKIKQLITKLKDPKLSSPELHVFFLSHDEDRNLTDLLTFSKDKTIYNLDKTKIKTRVYCHARKSGPVVFMEEIGIKRHLNIKIIDSSYLAVEQLKADGNNHPVNLVDISEDNPGTISSGLNALIIGFGEVGRDALRFLYEFGAFPDNVSTPDNVIRSPFSFTAIDPKMNEIEGLFIENSPALFSPDKNIKLLQLSCSDKRFFKDVLNDEACRKLNYIFIEIGNDDDNINVTVKILRHLRSKDANLEKLRIMVRCRRSDKMEMMRNYADFYNSAVSNEAHNNRIINIFGDPRSIFTYDLIIGNKIEEEAISFFNRYQQQSHGSDLWQQRKKKLLSPPINLDRLQKLNRQESQDIENALHQYTKIQILVRTLGRQYDWQGFLSKYFDENGEAYQTGSGANITYPGLTDYENHLILNLAITEHLRWMASHELLGYKVCENKGEGCDEKKLTHNCLVPWQVLDKVSQESSTTDNLIDFKIYDFYVVDTTISLNTEYLKKLAK